MNKYSHEVTSIIFKKNNITKRHYWYIEYDNLYDTIGENFDSTIHKELLLKLFLNHPPKLNVNKKIVQAA